MKPILLHYFLTNRCNARCPFCTIWAELPKHDAQTTDVLNNLKTARKAGCRFVDFTGGEPLLHEDLPELLSAAKQLGYITSVTTNCIVFPLRVKELHGRIDLLHFSLDADSPEKCDTLRGGVPSFDHVLESIPLALRHKLVPDLLFTYSDNNIDMFSGVYELARKNRLIAILDPLFSTDGPDPVSRTTHMKALGLAKKWGVYLNKAHLMLRFQGGNHTKKTFCRAVSSTIVITPDNRQALPCYHHRTSLLPLDFSHQFYGSKDTRWKEASIHQGKYPFCEGCHINCYFDPSYNYLCNRLFFQSLGSKFRYIIMKYFIYGHFNSFLRLY